MSRAEHRRNERLIAKGKLTPEEIDHLETERRQWEHSPQKELREAFLALLAIVQRSNVLPYLERRLRKHPGTKSRLTLEMMLVLFILNWYESHNYLRVDIHKTMLSLDPQSAYDLGLCTRDAWHPITLNVIQKQFSSLEHALEEAWALGMGWRDSEDGTLCSPEWLMDRLALASVPRQARRNIRSCALDATHFKAYSRPFNFTPQKIAKQLGQRASKDRHAEFGYKTPTRLDADEMFLGFHLTVVTGQPYRHWDGKPGHTPKIANPPAPFALSGSLTPAGANHGIVGLRTVLQAKKVAPGISRVVADLGYTDKIAFVEGLLENRIRLTKDYKKLQLARPKAIQVTHKGRAHTLIMHAGCLFPPWMPPSLLATTTTPDPGPGPGPLSKRAENWRYRLHKIDYTAKTAHFICPVCDGRLTYNGSTKPHQSNVPNVAGPGKGQPCCNGMVAIDLNLVAEYQDIPWGTIAWKGVYRSDRARMEGFNGTVRNRNGLDAKCCRVFDIAAHTLAATAALVVYNIRVAKEHGQTDLDDTPEKNPPTNDTDPKDETDPTGDTDPDQQRSPP